MAQEGWKSPVGETQYCDGCGLLNIIAGFTANEGTDGYVEVLDVWCHA